MKTAQSLAFSLLLLSVLFVGAAGATTNLSNNNGVYTATVSVPGVGDDCSNLSVQITYDSSNQTVGFQHAGGATSQTVNGTTAAATANGGTATAQWPAGSTGVAPHSAGASGTALPIHIAKGLAGGQANATSTATISYSFTRQNCVYSITLTVAFLSDGSISSVTSNP